MRPVTLTPRERTVFLLLEKGLGDKDIARELGIATNTAKCHIRNVRRRLGSRVHPRKDWHHR